MIEEKLREYLQTAAEKAGIQDDVVIDTPIIKEYGDFATGIALKAVKALKKSPLIIAEEIINHIPKNKLIDTVKIVKPGFINIWVDRNELLQTVEKAAKNLFIVPPLHLGPQKKIMVEFAHPNTHKLFHIGHLRNIATGESIVRLLEATGNTVIRTNYQGDVGLHIAKCLYHIRKQGIDLKKPKTLQEKIKLLGSAYAAGQEAYETDENAKQAIHEVNRMIYEKDPEILPLWSETVQWSIDYFEDIYKRVYSRFDRCYFESEISKRGLNISHDLLQKGVLKKSKGAVVFDGKSHGVDTRVFINSLGFPTYEGKELGLAEKEFSDFGEIDKNIHVVTPEQTSFFQTTFKVEELIDEKKYKGKQYHLAYNWVKLKEGKMSSRIGNIIEGVWLIDEAKKRLRNKFKLNDDTAEILAVASVKYSFLKISTKLEIYYDFEESISLEGNSAPYLIYTYVRTQSVLQKTKQKSEEITTANLNEEERQLLRKLYQYSKSVYDSANKLSPNILATYLFELAQDFNLFYQKNPINKAEKSKQAIRLMFTRAVGNTLRHGLDLLGIKTVEKM
ncbi:MAG: arginine--tRNA ligase [Patescibacteria group bacterium]